MPGVGNLKVPISFTVGDAAGPDDGQLGLDPLHLAGTVLRDGPRPGVPVSPVLARARGAHGS